MIARETLAAIRFGYGLRPGETTSAEVPDMLAAVKAAARRPKGVGLARRAEMLVAMRDARKMARDGGAEDKGPQEALRMQAGRDMKRVLTDAVDGAGFGERLVMFWADHFTVAAGDQALRVLVPDFVQSAIRPHIDGRFSDMLFATVTHPAMLRYLNQAQSVGPNSQTGKRRDRGLNENLAREVLELHTLGVNGSYAQTDVRNLALVLTGLSFDKSGFLYRRGIAEPGRHQVLGTAYGGQPKTLDHVRAGLNDIARHKDTARHIATKLVVHFVGAPADPELVGRIERAFRSSDGTLIEAYRALLSNDGAWQPELTKAKTPVEFVVSALRASGADAATIEDLPARNIRRGIVKPLTEMGQTPLSPPGPDGWDEDPTAWITPPLLAARIRWALGMAERIAPDHDPRAFLETTLADAASEKLAFAVKGAESRIEGITLTLVSPEFNRR